MDDVFGNLIREGDICALSTRSGKHDSCIKILYVSSIHSENGDGVTPGIEFLRGYDGAGRLTEVRKANNLAVVTGSIRAGNSRLKHILERLGEAERAALLRRLRSAD